MRRRLPLALLIVLPIAALAAVILAVGLLRRAGYDVVRFRAAAFVGHWASASDRSWVRATSGWVAFGSTGIPKVDQSFDGMTLAIGGRTFDRGIGAFAPSEVVYDLDPSDSLFAATIGINDGGPPGEGSATFSIFLDDLLLYQSPLIRSGQPGRDVIVPLTAPGRLRLVVQPVGPLSPWNLATWGDARIFQSVAVLGVPQELGIAVQAARTRSANATRRSAAESRLGAQTALRAAEVDDDIGASDGGTAVAAFDEARGDWVIGNESAAFVLGVGTQTRGQVSVLRRKGPQLILDRSTSSVEFTGRTYRLAEGTPNAADVNPARVNVSGFGPGTQITIPFSYPDGTEIQVSVIALDDSPAFLYQLQPAAPIPSGATYDYVDGNGALLLGDQAQYLTDVSRIRSGSIRDDGVARHESIDFGKPLLVWGGALGAPVLMATIDETDLMTDFAVLLTPGQLQADVHYAARRSRPMGSAPRLYLEVSDETRIAHAFDRYRTAMGQLYPTRPPPSWLRYQWSTWYVYFMGISDAAIRAQIDYIADHLADLGPWHVVIDAGWYVAEGRPGSSFENVDRAKFPDGIRPVVDYAHSRGVKVALYLSVPYLDSREQSGDWLGLRGVIDAYRPCLTILGSDPSSTSYAFDFDRPCTRDYWRSVLTNYFRDYDVDGLVVDGLGFAEGAKVSPRRLDPVGIVDRVAEQTVDIYQFMYQTASRLKSDMYLEGGWHFPMMAKPYATSFWLSDSVARFSSPYPFAGLVEAVDYAAFQRIALGQPAHLGWINDLPSNDQVNRWRLEAALALACMVGDGTNLLDLTPRNLAALRARLVHLRPYVGTTVVDDPQRPTVFGTMRDDLAFIGMLNRSVGSQQLQASLTDFGLSSDRPYTVYTPEDDAAKLAEGAIVDTLEGESFRLSVIPLRPGVVWTDSSYVQRLGRDALVVRLRGPTSIRGFAAIYAPGLQSVSMDERQLTEGVGGPLGRILEGDYQYDETTGILRLRYDHDQEHVLRIALR